MTRLTSRAVERAVPAAEGSAVLDTKMRMANSVAAAKDALPQSYRDKPGAVLLAIEWAESRDVDLLTAIQTVNFINGRPVIDATMQRALAKRAGYTVRIVEASATEATVHISGNGVDETESFHIDEAKAAGLVKAGSNWEKWPKNMCVARATTNAMRFHAPEVMVGLLSDAELDDPPESSASIEDLEVDAPAGPDGDGVVDAEVVEPQRPRPAPVPPVVPTIAAAGFAEMAAAAEGLPDATKKDLANWARHKGFPQAKKSWTPEQYAAAIKWIDDWRARNEPTEGEAS